MGLFDYMFDGYKDDPRGLFDGLFSQRWDPVTQGLQSGVMDPQGSNNTSAYTAPPQSPQFPIQVPGGAPPRAPPPGYYGGSPSTNPLLAPQDPQNAPPQAPPRQQPPVPQNWPPGGPDFQGQQPSPGMGDRFSAGLQGAQGSFFNGGGPIGAIVNLLGGLTTGKRTDPQGVANEEAIRMYKFLQTKEGGGLSPAQAQGVIMHPDLAKEYYKGLVNSPPIFAPDGTILQQGTFGAPPNVVGSAPKAEPQQRYNPVTGRMELTFVTPPTIGNQDSKVTVPGQAPTLPGQGTSPTLPGQANTGVGFATAPSVTEKKTQEGLAEANVADYSAIQKQAVASSNLKTVLQRMRQLNAMKNLPEGELAPLQQTWRSAMVSLGVGDPKGVKAGEEFQQLANGIVLDSAGGSLGNQISDGDRGFLAARVPQIKNTQAGRAEMLETVDLLHQRKIDIAKEASKYRMSHGGDLDGFQTYIADWAEKHPLFKDRTAVTPSEPGAEGPIRIPATMSPADVRKNYKSGTKIILPDGRQGTVP